MNNALSLSLINSLTAFKSDAISAMSQILPFAFKVLISLALLRFTLWAFTKIAGLTQKPTSHTSSFSIDKSGHIAPYTPYPGSISRDGGTNDWDSPPDPFDTDANE